MSATIRDLESSDRYLSLSLLDVHSNMTSLNITLSNLNQQQKIHEEKQNMTIQHLSLSLLDVHNNTAWLSSSLSNLTAQQKQMKSVQSNVAFTAGILGETNGQHTYRGTVKFPTVIYQVGGGHNPKTGVFTAPKTGLYLIFCINVAYYDESFWTKIMIDGSVKAGVVAYVSGFANTFQSASNLVVHQLQVGDRVWTEISSGIHLYSSFPDTTFSVIMINGSD
ncbi:multimerin-2-like [Saccostrea echinata]|uniref:multimerin-2-like n=1 Tax=Saccostrea echinata TaxID=191078 RepID=UPI002A7FE3A5|nr:multimerin-2-like [Saccostrea echinata]